MKLTNKFLSFLFFSILCMLFICSSCGSGQQKVTVIGKALEIKHHAFVLTKDSLLYYLNDIDHWDDEYLDKKVKVTGYLVIKKYELVKVDTSMGSKDSVIAVPQQRVGTWRILEKPEWKLIK